ncbi:Arylsulfotransferase (ASST) [Halomicrobium zhouii]|uniref:Arylsulfotransferase (ASST) n=1 Tax=Halomicrobium zhouii TaxID=767519 RepID=A0A1I6M2M1_9EURY|nr:arylsulfotransferase family protein [Halomicrobium zhouii]SFS09772.1 Arylsulfotransferase (ASST) [Halomicrobium zhouii]
MDLPERGTILVFFGVVLLISTLSVSATMAPSRDVDDKGARTTLIGSQGGGPGWHGHGSVYRLDGDNVTWKEGSADSYFDVTKLPNGSIMAGFMHSGYEKGCSPYESPCTKTGFRIIDPDGQNGPKVLSESSFPVRTQKNSEVHDVERLSTGEYLITDMDHERVYTQRDGEITWQWNASSLYEAPPEPTKRDWLHINDVDAINGTHYLVSVRNANQVIIIERGNGVVEIINQDDDGSDSSCLKRNQLYDHDDDDDVRCGDPAILNHQHNPQWLDSGAVLVADSDNDRIVELHKNNSTNRWEPVWVLSSADGLDLHWPRDADRLPNGNTLITDTLNQRVFEINQNGTMIWSTSTERIPYEADRLPENELVGADRYGSDGSRQENTENNVPLLSSGIVLIRAVIPSIPFWFGEIQLGLFLISFSFISAGTIKKLG